MTDRQFLEVYGGMVDDPANDPTLDHLADFTAVRRFDVTPEVLRRTAAVVGSRLDAALVTAAARPRVAAVAPLDAVYQPLRVYTAYRGLQESPVRFRICRTMDEAWQWLKPKDGVHFVVPPAAFALRAPVPGMMPFGFTDPLGVRWTVVPRVVADGPEPAPDGFEFTSEYGQRRFLQWDPRDFFSAREADHDEWRALLRASTVVR